MNEIPNSPCRKCGGDTSIHFVKSTGMDITPTGMFRTCGRCGFEEGIKSLDDENKYFAEQVEEMKKMKGLPLSSKNTL